MSLADNLQAAPFVAQILAASTDGLALFDAQGTIIAANHALAELLGDDPTGRALDDLFADPSHALAVTTARRRGQWRGRLRRGEAELQVGLAMARDGHGALTVADLSERLEADRRAASLAAAVAEQASRAESAAGRLTGLYQMTVNALESATVRDTADRLCTTLLRELQAANAALWLHDAHQGLLRRIAAAGPRAVELPEVFARQAAPQCDEALLTGRPAPASDLGPLAGFAAVPLAGREQPLGLLTLDREPDAERVQVYAPHVATAINNAIMADELTRANQQLRAVDQQKSEFLNVVAHDLRTPLTCIRTYTDLLRIYVDEPPETYRDFLTIIAEETERLGELLDNFLDLARIENATIHYDLEPVDLNEILGHFANVYLAKAASEAIILAHLREPGLPHIRADRRRLEQVISNLISNAFRHTPRGGNVTLRAQPDAAGGVRVSVDDTGPGVPADDRTLVFERFRQARNANHAAGGTGLGLAIARGIVADHGGHIWVEDAPGGGARFCVSLPAVPPETAAVWRGQP